MKKLVSIILGITLIFSFSSVANAQITKDEYFARSTLSGNELEFYDTLYTGIDEMKSTINVSSFDIKKESVDELIYSIDNDTPGFFYKHYYTQWHYNGNNIITEVYITYDYSANEVDKLNDQLQQKSKEILSQLNDGMTDYEKVKTIYLWLGNNIYYNYDAAYKIKGDSESKETAESNTIIGGMLNEEAVCGGIARSLQYLLYQIDVPCYTVTGAYQGFPHAWSMIQIDGEWYYADLTKDLSRIKNDYVDTFLYDDSLLKDHLPDKDKNPPLPACTSTKYMKAEATPKPTKTAEPVAAAQVSTAPEPPKLPESIPAPDNMQLYVICGIAVLGALITWLTIAVRKKKKA